ncbi:TPA: hypothetical protein ACLBZX_005113 [Bacillus cereus]|uniref:hypothetical protein n=1 Tax=unclassified Bacillus cereus group TaxID=2750818 RepID=UPI00391E48ED
MEKQHFGRCVALVGSFSLGLSLGAFISESYTVGSLLIAAAAVLYFIGFKLITKGGNLK